MEKNSKYREGLKNEKIDMYYKTDFFEVVSQAKRFKLNSFESAPKTNLENRF
jgi:hypothetical protein